MLNDDIFNNELNGLFLQCYIAKICSNVCKVYEFGFLQRVVRSEHFQGWNKFYRVYAVLEKLSIPDLDTLRFEMSKKEREKYNFRELIRQSLTALKCMNTNNFIHSDIKLSNIGVGLDGYARLFDFGLASYIPDESVDTVPYGTPYFMDPFLIENNKIHKKSDIYSFGITLRDIYFEENKKLNKRVHYDNNINESQKEEDTKRLINLIELMTAYDPNKRISVQEVLDHVWFRPPIYYPPEKPIYYPPEKEKSFFSWLTSRSDPRIASNNSSDNSSKKNKKISSNISSRRIKRISSNNSSRRIKRISSNNSSRKK
jgi:serine/threonine protein kinase